MKKMMTGMMLMAAVAVFGTSMAFADGVDKVDTKGIKFTIPEELRDVVTIKYDDNDAIVSVYETASVEAARDLGEEYQGSGWIFSISTVPEKKMKELRCGDLSGMEVFAEDDDIYYVFNHPTDVRLFRDSNEEMEAAMDQWTMLNQWAGQEVRQEILANNKELDPEFYTNTYLDILLAQAAYMPGTKFELRSLDYGPDPLDPSTLKDNEYAEDLAEDYTYEILSDTKAPDGEYYVLAFNPGDDEIRFDFFKASEGRNLIRESRMVGDSEYVTLYQANAKELDDADETTTDILEKWCRAIANGDEDEDDDDD